MGDARARLTTKQLKLLATVPDVIEALRALRTMDAELTGLLGPASGRPRAATVPALEVSAVIPFDPEKAKADAAAAEAFAEAQRQFAQRNMTPEERSEQAAAARYLQDSKGQREALLKTMLGGGTS